MVKIDRINDFMWEISKTEHEGMRVPVHLYANERIEQTITKDRTLQQAINASTLPSIVEHMLLMPDAHEGYSFPIGGVAAFDAESGIVSPGAVGYDINCLHPDTEVQLADTTKIAIKDMEFGSVAASFDLHLNRTIRTEVALKLSRGECSHLNEITTRSGRSLLLTDDHPILTKAGMLDAGLVEKGVKVVVKDGDNYRYDEISRIEKVDYNGQVYDLAIADSNHNFIANGIVVSNCGVRLIRTNLDAKDVRPRINPLMDALFRNVPSGVGSKIRLGFTQKDVDRVAVDGVGYMVSKGYGFKDDTDRIEENGRMEGADPSKVSDFAKKRGEQQLGTLGAGNHFLEVQRVDRILDEEAAKLFGLHRDQVVVMLHSGSRGYGHQVCSDYLERLSDYQRKNSIVPPDPELMYAFVGTREAEDYLAAMRCAVNFAFTNRQIMTHFIRKSFEETFGKSADSLGMELLYDLSHNIAKLEEHDVDGKRMRLYVHRKGATRAFGPGRKEIPKAYREHGQPVIIPGSMGTASYVLIGQEGAMKGTFGSSCHGSGRLMSRHQAIREIPMNRTLGSMESKGIAIRVRSRKLISEEAMEAYKDVDQVVSSIEGAGISRIVARMVPLGVAKG